MHSIVIYCNKSKMSKYYVIQFTWINKYEYIDLEHFTFLPEKYNLNIYYFTNVIIITEVSDRFILMTLLWTYLNLDWVFWWM